MRRLMVPAAWKLGEPLLVAFAFVALTLGGQPAPPAYTIQMKLVPKGVYGHTPSQLLVTTRGGPLGGLKLSLRATNGFSISPAEVAWPAGATHATFVASADLTPSTTSPPNSASVVASLSRDEGGVAKTLVTEILDFDYQPALGVTRYLFIGALGVGIGYLLRLAIKALSEAESAAKLALGATPAPTGLREFVLKHYYLVDFAVTLILGLLVLMSLMKDGRPPMNASYWYNALVIGVGLGLLTNSDLLTRVK